MLRIIPIMALFSSNLRQTFARDYALAVHVPTDSTSCNTGNTISFQFYSNCTMLVYTCNSYDAITSAQTYFPVSIGTTYYSSFTAADIGAISHIQFTINGADAYCIQSFDILLNDTTQLWSNCTIEYASHMVIMSTADETGLFASGSMKDITFRVDDQSTMCTQWSPYTESPTNNPTIIPTAIPTTYPSVNPSMNPTISPTTPPSTDPTVNPNVHPSMIPSLNPSLNPSINPSMNPTVITTDTATDDPTSTASEPTQVVTTTSVPPNGQLTISPTENSCAKSNSNAIDMSSELFVAYVIIATLVFCLGQVFCACVIIYFYKRHNKQKEARKNCKGVAREIEIMDTSNNDYDNLLESGKTPAQE